MDLTISYYYPAGAATVNSSFSFQGISITFSIKITHSFDFNSTNNYRRVPGETYFCKRAPWISNHSSGYVNIAGYIQRIFIATLGSNFGDSADGKPLSPTFSALLAGNQCQNITFEIPHQKFTCNLGNGGDPVLNLWVGDVGMDYSQLASYSINLASTYSCFDNVLSLTHFTGYGVYTCDEAGIDQAVANGIHS